MGKTKKKKGVRADPVKHVRTCLCNLDTFEELCAGSYVRLSQNPEIMAGVNKIADLISSMTIHLMGNQENGDVRIRNELSKKVDIYPNPYMTRKTFISCIVRGLLLEGDGNQIVLPRTERGLLSELIPIPPGQAGFVQDGYGYRIMINGTAMDPREVLHFVINPDPAVPWKGTGYRVALREVADNLKQAAKTKKGFMESKWKPSMVVKVDGLTEEFASKEGRGKLLDQFIESSEAGEPWMIPADQFDVKEIRPLSLNDIAIADSVHMDKRTVAAVLDIPPFVVGEGEYKEAEWNNFVNTRLRPLCNAIEQELTRKLLISPDWYFRFNIRSLYAYDIEKLSRVADDNYTRGIMSGNEARDWLGLSPKEGLDELIILENYIPQGMIGDQKKLEGGDP